MPAGTFILILTMVCMIAFYATSFDSISLTCSYYSYKNLTNNETPNRFVKQFWAILLILFPIAFIFSEGTAANLQNIAVIFGFPGAILVMLVVASFFKDVNKYLEEENKK